VQTYRGLSLTILLTLCACKGDDGTGTAAGKTTATGEGKTKAARKGSSGPALPVSVILHGPKTRSLLIDDQVVTSLVVRISESYLGTGTGQFVLLTHRPLTLDLMNLGKKGTPLVEAHDLDGRRFTQLKLAFHSAYMTVADGDEMKVYRTPNAEIASGPSGRGSLTMPKPGENSLIIPLSAKAEAGGSSRTLAIQFEVEKSLSYDQRRAEWSFDPVARAAEPAGGATQASK
jgi:hypothetical protein